MAVAHLTDEEIQAFLDSNRGLDSSTRQHIDACQTCNQRLHQYRTLYRELDRQPVMNLSSHFEDTVLQKVGLLPRAQSGFHIWQWIASVIAFAACTGISLFFVGMEKIMQIQTSLTKIFSVTGSGLENVFIQQNFNLLLVSMLVIGAISLLDRIYITHLRR